MASSTTYSSAKDLLEEIGESVQKEAKNQALGRSGSVLHGFLSNATIKGVKNKATKPIQLEYEYHTNVTGGFDKNNPCANRLDVRFSDIYGGQCTDNKINGNDDESGGTCAPLRRLFLCDQHLSHMKEGNINNTDNLLLEVSLAAKYEGDSIINNYPDSRDKKEGICTALARSFADIGDIIRGKDLFLGYTKKDEKEKEKVQKNLRRIFNEIYKKMEEPAKSHYSGDSSDFYKLREDWWALNRKEVWKAITCKAKNDAEYFRKKDSDGKHCSVQNCKCVDGDPPTNLDYVPQHLRWFDEWSEEFCRKRRDQLKISLEKCRGNYENGEPKYCSLNGCNCKTTVRGKKKFDYEQECNDCLVACDPFVHWIDNQELEFEKQKKKYKNAINEKELTKETEYGTINNMYAEEFYRELEKQYKTVDSFLKLLNKEKQCENHPEVEEGKKSSIDFNNNETFSHTKICEPCPWCGVQEGGPPWKDNDIDSCGKKEISFSDKDTTDISILSTDRAKKNILQKLENFCRDTEHINHDIWKCHYEDSDNDNCILQNENTGLEKQRIMPFDAFFFLWIKQMLDDTIEWRNELKTCINNEKTSNCIRGCKKPCECFERWVEQKEEEWISIEKHYDKQGDMKEEERYRTLEYILNLFFMDKIEKAYGTEKSKQLKEKLKANKGQGVIRDTEHSQDAIKILLEHELEDAKKCTETHNDEKCKEQEETAGRSLNPDPESDDEEETDKVKENPCAGGKKLTKTVKQIARQMHQAAKKQLDKSGSRGSSVLKADATKGEYKRGGSGNNFKKLCSITDEDSNDGRIGNNGGACKGKDGYNKRFVIGTEWSNIEDKKQTSYKDVFLPPRREHMCTSNLEKLDHVSVTKKDNAMHSLLGDVLLSAKMDAGEIIERYKKQNKIKDPIEQKDKESICRAVRYSFADLGDIIRGRDMWDLDNGSTEMESHLEKIFATLHQSLEGIQGNQKYKDDKKNKPPYKQLREDWWEANRKDVWRAMKCATTSNKIPCSVVTPPDDYIPQRLRWLSEWAEWYCKMQKKEYEDLARECKDCRSKDLSCTNDTEDCTKCKKACDAYEKKIRIWRDQWTKMQLKYILLYLQAQEDAVNVRPTAIGDANDQQVIAFFKKLQEANGDTKLGVITPYNLASGYIHQEAHVGECEVQKYFCNNNGNQDKYVFRSKPQDHDKPCNCKNNKPPVRPPPRPPGEGDNDSRGRSERGEDELPRPPQPAAVNVCSIVDNIFKDTSSLNAACGLKYAPGGKERYSQWKCISSGSDATTGGLCIPPRRRKLYVGGLSQWASDVETTLNGVSTWPTSGSPPRLCEVRRATSDMQAVEGGVAPQLPTASFSPDGIPGGLGGGGAIPGVATQALGGPAGLDGAPLGGVPLVPGAGIPGGVLPEGGSIPLSLPTGLNNSDDPQSKLQQTGEIPPDFLRQMFYTLADYKDILFSVSKDMKSGDRDIFSGDKEMQNIKEKITNFFQNGVKKPGQTTTKPEDWWNENAKHIWNGMICALTYKDSEEKGKPPEMDTTVRDKLWDEQKKNPKANTATTKKYNSKKKKPVMPNPKSSHPVVITPPPKLIDFIKRPPYFRYLEEWGQNFCKERKKRLEKIKEECRGVNNSGDPKYCSGDGHVCDKDYLRHHKMFEDFVCREEHEKLKKDNSSGNGDNKQFCTEIKEKNTAPSFLKELKHCKNSEGDGSNPDNKIDFEKTLKTFGPLEYCKTCPLDGVNVNGRSRIRRTNACEENGQKWESVFNANGGNNTTTINVHMIDRISKQKWECKFKEENKDVCKLDKFDGTIDLNEYTTFKVFLEYWLEDFLYGYYILKKKKIIEKCTKNGKNICDGNYKNDCACVKEWVNQKTTEWGEIKEYFQKQTRDNAYNIEYKVKTFLEILIPRMDLVNDKGKINDLSTFLKSYGCNCDNNSEKESGKDGTQKDIVECLLEKLKKKQKSVKTNIVANKNTVKKPPPTLKTMKRRTYSLKKKKIRQILRRTFVRKINKKPHPEPEVEDGCEPAEVPKEVVPEKKVPVPPPKKPEAPPAKVPEVPKKQEEKPKQKTQKKREITHHILPEMASISAFPLSVGIAFAAFTYFLLK
ncbi:erythrocyte membrane protein 1, PfEMP1, putative, partial [Plasmodium sp. gorilla clade G1]